MDQISSFWEHVLVAFFGNLPGTLFGAASLLAVIVGYLRGRMERLAASQKAELAATHAAEAARAAALAVRQAEIAAQESKLTREVIKDAVTNGPLKMAVSDAVKQAIAEIKP